MLEKIILFFFGAVVLFFAFIVVSTAIQNNPTPMKYGSGESITLTSTSLQQLQKPTEYFNLFFDESDKNPYVFGWDNDTLYFKDGWNTAYSWNAQNKKIMKVTISDPQFLRQTKSSENCNKANRPNYETIKNYPGGIDAIECRRFQQGSTIAEVWPLAMEDRLSFTNHRLVIQHADKKLIIDEPRLVSDVVISPDEKYVAVTASNPAGFPNSFASTNIHVIELK